MYFVTVTLRAQSRTAPSSIVSTTERRRTSANVPPLGSAAMPEPTFADVDELVGPATPHFAYQLRARVRELVLDLPDEHPVRRYAEEKVELLAAGGPYRVVVHNAATGVIRPALETEDKHWDWTLAANARALLSLARATVPAMEGGGSILAISSLGAQRVLPNYVLVGTSKAALESVVRYLAVDLAPRGIRVNCVSAGVVDTEALDWFPNKEQMLASVKRTPAGRLVEPADVAAVVSFLCSPDAAMICGQTLVVGGGFSLGV